MRSCGPASSAPARRSPSPTPAGARREARFAPGAGARTTASRERPSHLDEAPPCCDPARVRDDVSRARGPATTAAEVLACLLSLACERPPAEAAPRTAPADPAPRTTPAPAPAELAIPAGRDLRVTQLAVGDTSSCARFADGAVRCWGYCGQGFACVSAGDTGPAPPTRVQGLREALGVTVGSDHACAWHADGSVSCWGSNFHGALGTPGDTFTAAAVRVPDLRDVVQVVSREHEACARHQDGTITCWGGLARTADEAPALDAARRPARVQGLADATELLVVDRHHCARTRAGPVRCWSLSAAPPDYTPVRTPGEADVLAGLRGRAGCGCEIQRDGAARCSALGRPGPHFGDGTSGPAPSLKCSIDRIEGVRAIASGGEWACALGLDRGVRCWGEMLLQIRDVAGHTWPGEPRPIPGLTDVQQLEAGLGFVCARVGERVLCFGDDSTGAITGTAGGRIFEPREVTFTLARRNSCDASAHRARSDLVMFAADGDGRSMAAHRGDPRPTCRAERLGA